MPDLAELNLVVKSSQVDQGKTKLDALRQAAEKVEKQNDKMKDSNSLLEGTYGRLLGLIAKITAAYSAMRLVIQAIATAAEFEQMEIGFKTILKSAEAAKKMMADLQKFAVETPFEFRNLAEAAKLMLALGFDSKDIIPNLRDIGDAVAAFGGGHDKMMSIVMDLGRMQASVKVTSREMLSLTQLGIPAWDILAKMLGVTIPEAMDRVEKGTVSGRMAVQGFLESFRTRFGGSMDELSKTLGGIYSNLKDRLFFTLKDVGEAFIEAFDIKGKLQAAYDNTERMSHILIDVLRVLAGLQPKFQDVAETVDKIVRSIKALAIFAAVFVAWEAGLQAVTIAMLAFNTAVSINPILFILAAASAAIVYFADDLVEAGKKGKTFGEDMVILWEAVLKGIRNAVDAMADYLGKFPAVQKRIPGIAGMPAGQLAPMTQTDLDLFNAGLPPGFSELGGANPQMGARASLLADLEKAQLDRTKAAKEERDRKIKQELAQNPIVDDEALGRAIKQFEQMNEQLDMEFTLLGKTSEAREVATAKMHLEKMQLQGLNIEQQEYLDKLAELQKAKKLEEIAKGIGDAFGQAFEDMIMGAKSVGEAMQALAQDIEKALLRGLVTQPLAQGITGMVQGFMGGAGAISRPSATLGPMGSPNGVPGAIGGPTAVGSRLGNIFLNGSIVPFSKGGIVGSPTFFPMQGGLGLMGEDGEEGILPLGRDSRGRLGVRGGGGVNVTMHIHTNDADSFRRSKKQIMNDLMQQTRRG